MSAPTITIRFTGDLKDLEKKTRSAADTINRTGDQIGAPSAKQKTAFSSLQDRFKQLVGIGKQHGQETGDGFAKEVESRGGGGFSKLGTLAKGALLGLGAKLGLDLMGEFTSALTGASELEQSVGGLEAVFKGGAFKVMDEQAKGAAKTFGLSRNAYNELATTLGAGLKNKGIEDYAGSTQKLIGLGSDLAAQFGGSTSEAVDAISSLMRGESDPIERYGVAINETAISAELAAKGQTHLKGAALEQAKAQARVDILMRQTADAQGAFGRESDTLAGKQQRAGAMWEDLKTKIGTGFLPVLTQAMGFLSDTALPAIEAFTGKAGPALKGLWDLIVGGDFTSALTEAFGISADHPVVGWILDTRDTVLGVYDEIVGGARAFVESWLAFDGDITSAGFPGWMEDLAVRVRTGFEGIQGAIGRMWEVVQPIAMQVYDWLITKWAEIQPAVSTLFASISETVSSGMEYAQAIIARVTDVIKWIWDTWGENILTTLGIIVDTIIGIFTGISETVGGIWKTLTGLLTGDLSKAKEGIEQIAGGMWKTISSVFTGIKDSVINNFDAMLAGVERVWGGVRTAVGKPINAVIGFINTGIIGSYNWVAEKLGMGKMGTIPQMSLSTGPSGRGSRGGKGANTMLAGGGFVRLPWDPARRDPYTGVTPGGGAFRFEGEEFFVQRSSTARLERTHPGLLSYLNRHGDLPAHAGGGMTSYQGKTFTSVFAGLLRRANELAGGGMHISQGGFRPRTSYSGTSHAGDAVDITGGNYRKFIAPLRSVGIPTWDRAGKGNWVDHAHGVPLPGSGTARGSAVWQAQDYLRGGDGLGGRDNGPRGGAVDQAAKSIGAAISAGFDSVAGWFQGIRDKISSALPDFGGGMIGDLADGISKKLQTGTLEWAKSKLGYRAGTRSAGSGLYWAGESGAELIDFRGGERVQSLAQLRAGQGQATSGAVEELIARLVDAIAEREVPSVQVALSEGDIRRVVQSEIRRGRGVGQ